MFIKTYIMCHYVSIMERGLVHAGRRFIGDQCTFCKTSGFRNFEVGDSDHLGCFKNTYLLHLYLYGLVGPRRIKDQPTFEVEVFMFLHSVGICVIIHPAVLHARRSETFIACFLKW